ncbi:MAG TPA: DUF2924 domain-containing protein [Candidatus Omnitrophota bacterium]|nr:DUF2924 domain-containing protein [Candidatus Omnitrophota bacterium]
MSKLDTIEEQMETLKTSETAQLLEQYRELFGDKAVPGNRIFLIRKLAYRLQEQAIGGISTGARNRIQELIRTYDPVNKIAIKTKTGKTTVGRDVRLPMPGSLIIKTYKGNRIEVKVLENGFEYQGAIYKNLSAVAKAITGDHWNGFIFFGLTNGKR